MVWACLFASPLVFVISFIDCDTLILSWASFWHGHETSCPFGLVSLGLSKVCRDTSGHLRKLWFIQSPLLIYPDRSGSLFHAHAGAIPMPHFCNGYWGTTFLSQKNVCFFWECVPLAWTVQFFFFLFVHPSSIDTGAVLFAISPHNFSLSTDTTTTFRDSILCFSKLQSVYLYMQPGVGAGTLFSIAAGATFTKL